MNNARRSQLETLAEALEDFKLVLATLKEEEAWYLNNMPDNLQGGVRYESAVASLQAMNDAIGSMDDAIYGIQIAKNWEGVSAHAK